MTQNDNGRIEELREQFVRELERKRLAEGWSKKELASLMNISQQRLSRILHGTEPTLGRETIFSVAEQFKLMLAYGGFMFSHRDQKHQVSNPFKYVDVLELRVTNEKDSGKITIEPAVSTDHLHSVPGNSE